MTELLLNPVFGCWELPQAWNSLDNRLYVADKKKKKKKHTKFAYIMCEINGINQVNLS